MIVGSFAGALYLGPALLPAAATATSASTAEILGPRTVAEALRRGLLNPNGRLSPLLANIEQQFAAAAPKNPLQAVEILNRATRAAGLDLGFGSVAADGGLIIKNVGGITTLVSPSGQITFLRGAEVILQLL